MIYEFIDVRIRDFQLEDIALKVAWINNPNNNTYLHYDLPLSIEGTQKWFISKNSNRVDCLIEYQDIPVGVIGLLNIDQKNLKAEYYITIGESDYKNKGIATKATIAILKYAFQELGLRKVYLNVDEDNIAACKLYEKCGFQCEGVFIEDMWFKDKWINRKRYSIFENQISEGII